MSLYTFFFEFRGGTYISQVHAVKPADAKNRWAHGLNVDEISGMGPATKAALTQIVADDDPTAVEGMKNVWCIHGIVLGHPYLVHFVESAST